MRNDRLINRRTFLGGVGAAAAGAMAPGFVSNALADKFPSKSVVGMMGFPPGGGLERSSRVFFPAWMKTLGATDPFKFTFLPGAGGLIGFNKWKRSPADGHYIHLIPLNYIAWYFELEKVKWPKSEVSYVGSFFTDPDILLVKKDAKWNTIDEFIKDSKKSKKPLTVGVSSPFSSTHTVTTVLREMTGANIKTVFFKGGSKSRNAVAGGHVDATMAPYWSALHVFGLVKAIGIFAEKNPAPDLWQPVPVNQVLDVKIPTMLEPYSAQVVTDVKRKNPDHYKKLVDSYRAMMDSKELKQTAKKHKLTRFLKYLSPAECDKWIKDYLVLLKDFKPAMVRDIKGM
jgi:tripartite-type tricarboxylate transporter receptor subunit TctC